MSPVSPPCRAGGPYPLVQCLELTVALGHCVPPAIAQHLHPEHLPWGQTRVLLISPSITILLVLAIFITLTILIILTILTVSSASHRR